MSIRASKPCLIRNGNTSTLTIDATYIVTLVPTLETMWLDMSTTLPTIASASSVRHVLPNGTFTVLKAVIISMGTSTLRTCSKGMSELCTIVADTSILIQ